jgi:hypothetical protein
MRPPIAIPLSILVMLLGCEDAPPSFDECLIEGMRGQNEQMLMYVILHCAKADPAGYEKWQSRR